jgi:F0F1-type ATP synthase membrane subunit b/b'
MLGFLDEGIVVLLSFIVFIIAGFKPIKRGILSSIDARISETVRALEEATKLRTEAEGYLKAAMQELESAKVTAEDIVQHAQNRATTLLAGVEKQVEIVRARKENAMHARLKQHEVRLIKSLKQAAVNEVIEDLEHYFASELGEEQQETLFTNTFARSKRLLN